MSDEEKFATGFALMQKMFPDLEGNAGDFPANFTKFSIAQIYGDVWQGTELELKQRSLITCATLVALGREAEQRLHFTGARNLGVPRSELEAAIEHVAVYAGWPVSVSAFRVLAEVWPQEEA